MGDHSDRDGNSKGAGYRGDPRRRTGKGPAPARHIPWPEIFKHHQSVLSGHLKMMDMIRKHTVEGSGNYQTADACVVRAQEMLRDFKRVSTSFVPPKDQFARVPVGVSSASMYPGYSPADHIYGEAAQEFGMQVVEARKKGLDWKPSADGPEYIVGQSTTSGQRNIEGKRKKSGDREESGVNQEQLDVTMSSTGDPMEGIETAAAETKPLFFVDTEPTPVAGLNGTKISSRKEKRKVSFGSAEEIKSPEDRKKRSRSSNPENVNSVPAASTDAASNVEEDDISAEVEARLMAKEEKRKSKKEGKKRKRESEGSSSLKELSIGADHATTNSNSTETETVKKDKPTKKKHKTSTDASTNIDEPTSQPRPQSENIPGQENADTANSTPRATPADETEKKKEKKEKKGKKSKSKSERESDGSAASIVEGEGRKKKKKRERDH